MHTMARFLTALRLRTDQETLEQFVLHCLRSLLDKEDSELRRMLGGVNGDEPYSSKMLTSTMRLR